MSRFLLIGQVALSTMRLACAGLFVRTPADLYSKIDAGISSIPGVQAVTMSSVAWIGGGMRTTSVTAPG